MLSTTLSAALGLGLVGGLHCAAMCGPLAVAGSCDRASRPAAREALGYLGGRLVAYALLGAIFGRLGAGAAELLPLEAFETGVMVLVALFAIARGVRLLRGPGPEKLVLLPKRRSPVLRFAAALVPRRGLALGLATGALPCGLLAAGWALAASSASPLEGALAMVVLSIATLPGLLAPLLAGGALSRVRAAVGPRAQGALWCALGLWVGLRPLVGGVISSIAGGGEHCG